MQPRALQSSKPESPSDERNVIGESLDRQLGQVLVPSLRKSLVDFLVVLRAWNRVHNLTAIRDLHEQVRRHLVEPVLGFQAISSDLDLVCPSSIDQPLRLLDVGSGAGVPAIPWSIMGGRSFQITLVEKVGKKAAFLRRVVHQLMLDSRVSVIEGDVRRVKAQEPYQVISSRAFASLNDFIDWTQHLLISNGAWLYLAGQLDRIVGLQNNQYHHPDPSVGVRPVKITPVYLPGQEASHLVWISKEGNAC